jgi:hypothetical protein
MAFFKRVEVWVLLVLTVGIVVAVLRMEQSDGGDERLEKKSTATSEPNDTVTTTGDKPEPRHRIAALQIERDGDHAVLEIRLKLPEDTKDSAFPAPNTKARLLRTDGSQVAEFFVPSAAIPPANGGVRNLLFWADRSTLAGELFLEVDGERLKVKEADGFKLDAVKDGGRKVLS